MFGERILMLMCRCNENLGPRASEEFLQQSWQKMMWKKEGWDLKGSLEGESARDVLANQTLFPRF